MQARFQSLSHVELTKEARTLGVSAKGRKADIVARLVAALPPAGPPVAAVNAAAQVAATITAAPQPIIADPVEPSLRGSRIRNRPTVLVEPTPPEIEDVPAEKRSRVTLTTATTTKPSWDTLLDPLPVTGLDLPTRFQRTVECIDLRRGQDLSQRATQLADGLAFTGSVEGGDFVAVLRHLPQTMLTWGDLLQVDLDFYQVLRVSPTGVVVTCCQPFGSDAGDDASVPGPIVLPSNGAALRATGTLLQNLRRSVGTKTPGDAAAGHKYTYYDSITGTSLRYTDKSNVTSRVPASRVMRRMSTTAVLEALMDDEIQLDATKAWAKLTKAAHLRAEHHSSCAGLQSQKWSAIKLLPISKRGKEYFLKIAEGAWGGQVGDSTELSLGWFHQLPLSTNDNVADKLTIATALENLGRFLVFCHGGSWDVTLQPFIVRVREGDWAEDSWEAAYLRDEVEGKLCLFYNNLFSSSVATCLAEYEGDLSTSSSVEAWLADLLRKLIPSDPRQNKFLRAPKPKPPQKAATQTGSTVSQSVGKVPAPSGQFCRYHFLHELGVETSAGEPYRACRDGAACDRTHVTVSKLSKQQIKEMANRLIAIPGFGKKVKAQLERTLSARA